ncbi:Galactose mutarotase [Solimicrobium silvestre]|uniref:Aldose 1-epimerase n=2 Tax=Solimicrobium silvestre TaxID=2099400 RepID=A0A2S9H098_9BURK|nr:Galactose mutarotase [Solimicrobium silvestre]
MTVTVSPHGASLVSWLAPDRDGQLADVLLGYRNATDYVNNFDYFGAIVGRWANRISTAHFTLDGVQYHVDSNDGIHHLHGGYAGLHRVFWQVTQSQNELILQYLDPDGSGGFPGNLRIVLRYRLDELGQLSIVYEAHTDRATPVNLTSHPYFNLNGGLTDIGEHLLTINASYYLQTDADHIPIQCADVSGSAFDFRQPAAIGPRLSWLDAQPPVQSIFDHCYCVQPERDGRSGKLRQVAAVFDPASGRNLSVCTDQAGLQFYSGNFLTGVSGRGNSVYERYAGFCLEAQAYPNQINSPWADAVVLRPGQIYRQTTIYRVWV